jgi:hypothetical protein
MGHAMTHLPSDRILAFIDFLGFRSLVRKMEEDPSLHDLIRTTLDEIREKVEWHSLDRIKARDPDFAAESYPIMYTQFSDSLVVSVEANHPHSAQSVLMVVSELADRLLLKGIFVRGGISMGWARHDSNIVYGRAMIDAYRLESEVARYPRIVVSDQVREKIQLGPHAVWVKRDFDGIWYSQPFRHMWIGFIQVAPDDEELMLAREQIYSGLKAASSDVGLLAKYRWLAGKFNLWLDECDWCDGQSIPTPIEF